MPARFGPGFEHEDEFKNYCLANKVPQRRVR